MTLDFWLLLLICDCLKNALWIFPAPLEGVAAFLEVFEEIVDEIFFKGTYVAQYKFTVLLMPNGPHKITGETVWLKLYVHFQKHIIASYTCLTDKECSV